MLLQIREFVSLVYDAKPQIFKLRSVVPAISPRKGKDKKPEMKSHNSASNYSTFYFIVDTPRE